MTIFNSYVSLPEGNIIELDCVGLLESMMAPCRIRASTTPSRRRSDEGEIEFAASQTVCLHGKWRLFIW